MRGDPELQSQSKARSSRNSLLSLKYMAYHTLFFPAPLKPRCQGRVMGFVGGGSNVAIATALLPSSFVCCKRQIVNGYLYLIFYGWLRIRFLDVETNPGLRCSVPAVCRILWSNVLGLAGNLSDLTMASSQYDIMLCSKALVSGMFNVSEVLIP